MSTTTVSILALKPCTLFPSLLRIRSHHEQQLETEKKKKEIKGRLALTDMHVCVSQNRQKIQGHFFFPPFSSPLKETKRIKARPAELFEIKKEADSD